MANRGVGQTRLKRWVVVVLASTTGGCIVHGGEEETHQPEWSTVGIVRFEATNQAGKTVGSGCTLDRSEYRDQIRFNAASGDKVDLSERFLAVITTPTAATEHADDPDYWCAQTDTQRYESVSDARCWTTLAPKDSDACFLEEATVGSIDGVAFLPDSSRLVQSETDGFTLSISVLNLGKQCVETKCPNSGLPGEQLAFVVE
jgi:hypothetical protein